MDVEAAECGSPVPPEETPPNQRYRHCSRSADRLPLILHLHLKVCCVGARADRLSTAGHALLCSHWLRIPERGAETPLLLLLLRTTSNAQPSCDVIVPIPLASVCHHKGRSALLKDTTEEWLLPSLPADHDAAATQKKRSSGNRNTMLLF